MADFTPFHLSVSEINGVKGNTLYQHINKITSLKDFQESTNYDHAVGRFTDDTRKKVNFITADCIFLDVDNDDKLSHEEWDDPAMWMTIAKFKKAFADVEHIISTSKSHRIKKDGRTERDRFHVYFPLKHSLSSVKDYEEHIQLLVRLFVRKDGISFFDTAAVDCARFFFGNKKGVRTTPEHNAGISVLDWIAKNPETKAIQDNLNKSRSSIEKTSGSSADSSIRNLWLISWLYKKLVKGKPIEVFYGELNIQSQTDEHWVVRCSSGKHEDKSASLEIDKVTYCWFCFTENKGGNPFDFIAHRDNEDKEDVIQRYCDMMAVKNHNRSIGLDGEVLEKDERTVLEKKQDTIVEEMNINHAVIQSGSHVGIMKWNKSKRWRGGKQYTLPELNILQKSQFNLLYYNRFLVMGEKSVTFDELWLRDSKRNHYEGIVFDPTSDKRPERGEAWNIWIDWYTGKSGYRRWIDEETYDKYKDWNVAQSDCKLYLEHIRENICGGVGKDKKELAYKWVLYWMADAIVNPTRRDSAVCLALRGGQGSGKGQFVQKFGEFFGTHFLHITNSEALTADFNWQMKDNLLIFADEATFAADKKQAEKIKGLITEETREVTKKFQDQITLPNFSRVIMASNNEWMLPSDDDDRRFFVLEMGDGWKQNSVKFGEMNAEWNSGGREAFLYYLVEYISKLEDFDGYDFQNEKFITAAHMEQILSTNPLVDWYVNLLEEGYFHYKDSDGQMMKDFLPETGTKTFWNTDNLHEDYFNYMKTGGSGGSRYLLKKPAFSKSLNKLIGDKKLFDNSARKDEGTDLIDKDGRRIREKFKGWKFASLDVLRDAWERRTGLMTWSNEQKLIETQGIGVIEELANIEEKEIIIKRKRKLVGDISSLIVDKD